MKTSKKPLYYRGFDLAVREASLGWQGAAWPVISGAKLEASGGTKDAVIDSLRERINDIHMIGGFDHDQLVASVQKKHFQYLEKISRVGMGMFRADGALSGKCSVCRIKIEGDLTYGCRVCGDLICPRDGACGCVAEPLS